MVTTKKAGCEGWGHTKEWALEVEDEGRMHIHIVFRLHLEALLPPRCGFCGDSGCVLRMRRVHGGGGGQAQPVSSAKGFFLKV